MKRSDIFLLITAATLVCSCKAVSIDRVKYHIGGCQPEVVSASESDEILKAHNALESFILSLNLQTKSQAEHSIESIQRLNKSFATKSSEPLPAFEIILSNGVENGFAIVGDASLGNEVLVYVPNGSLADTIGNPVMTSFYREMCSDLSKHATFLTKNDYDVNPVGVVFGEPHYELKEFLRDLTYEEAAHLGSQLYSLYFDVSFDYAGDGILTTWGQGAPYNNCVPYTYTSNNTTYHYYLGCVPVAVGQVLAYFNIPESLNWGLILSSPTITLNEYDIFRANAVALFLYYDVAVPLNTQYSLSNGVGLGGNYGYDIGPVLSSYGLSASYEEYGTDPLMYQLHKRLYQIMQVNPSPMIVGGNRVETNTQGQPSYPGHSWVVDQTMRQQKWMYDIELEDGVYKLYKFPVYGYLSHCVWGWDGSFDGWYSRFYPSENRLYRRTLNAYCDISLSNE